MRYRTATSNFHSMCPTPWDWKAWMNWNPPLKTMSQAMTTTTPHDVANGSAMARKPKTMSTIAHTIDFPEPRLERPAGVIILNSSLQLERLPNCCICEARVERRFRGCYETLSSLHRWNKLHENECRRHET